MDNVLLFCCSTYQEILVMINILNSQNYYYFKQIFKSIELKESCCSADSYPLSADLFSLLVFDEL